jgi:hypothetical protein
MLLSAGSGGGAVSPQAKKRRRNAVARTGGFHLRQQVKEAKRDDCRGGWSGPSIGPDQSSRQIMPLSAAGLRPRQRP